MTKIKCLDKGFVKLVDHMGSDASIAQSARVSYTGIETETKKISNDKSLIDYLIRNQHSSPLEMAEFIFHVKLPIFVARQIIRHRTANVNEISFRYSIPQDDFYVPELNRMQKQSEDNKQGSSKEIIDNPELYLQKMQDEQKINYKNYKDYLDAGLSKELARVNLSLSAYTEWIWKIDLNNLFKFIKLRIADDAQYEVRVYAQAKYDLIKDIVPYACESFEEHILGGKQLSKTEWNLIKNHLPNKTILQDQLKLLGWSKRRIKETLNKLGE